MSGQLRGMRMGDVRIVANRIFKIVHWTKVTDDGSAGVDGSGDAKSETVRKLIAFYLKVKIDYKKGGVRGLSDI